MNVPTRFLQIEYITLPNKVGYMLGNKGLALNENLIKAGRVWTVYKIFHSILKTLGYVHD